LPWKTQLLIKASSGSDLQRKPWDGSILKAEEAWGWSDQHWEQSLRASALGAASSPWSVGAAILAGWPRRFSGP